MFLTNATASKWWDLKSSLDRDVSTVSGNSDDPDQNRSSFFETWNAAKAGRGSPKIAKDVCLRLVIASNASGQGLDLEVQSLPGSAGVLNSHGILCQPTSPAILVESINLSANFFREASLSGPKPFIFVHDDVDKFIANLTKDQETFCAGNQNKT